MVMVHLRCCDHQGALLQRVVSGMWWEGYVRHQIAPNGYSIVDCLGCMFGCRWQHGSHANGSFGGILCVILGLLRLIEGI